MENEGESPATERTEKPKKNFLKMMTRALKKVLSFTQRSSNSRPNYRGSLDNNLRGRRYVRIHDAETLELEALNLQCASPNLKKAPKGKAVQTAPNLSPSGSGSEAEMQLKRKLGGRAESGRNLLQLCATFPEDSLY